MVAAYVDLRRLGGKKVVTATTRQLEAMIRLSEAHAKMRYKLVLKKYLTLHSLSSLVEKEDAEEAIRLIKECLKSSCTDPETGLIDMDLLNTGVSKADRDGLANVKRMILEILKKEASHANKEVKKSELLKAVNQHPAASMVITARMF